jgi:predicted lipoprotein with Yx(FWY)xxD motif
MNKLLSAALLISVQSSLFLASAAHAQAVSEKDGRLADAGGRTLYTFDKDAANASSCIADCAVMWPPFLAPADAGAKGDFGLVTRADGSQQWSHKGKPLYLYAGDSKPGEANGEGRGGVWHSVAMGTKRSTPSGYDAIKGNY